MFMVVQIYILESFIPSQGHLPVATPPKESDFSFCEQLSTTNTPSTKSGVSGAPVHSCRNFVWLGLVQATTGTVG